jgi:hypothetical protein
MLIGYALMFMVHCTWLFLLARVAQITVNLRHLSVSDTEPMAARRIIRKGKKKPQMIATERSEMDPHS